MMVLCGVLCYAEVHAQVLDDRAQQEQVRRSGGKAFALSLLWPGLGHRYVHQGWSRSAKFFAATDVTWALSLIGAQWRESDLIQNYETWATTQAGADVTGKSRAFFLNLGTYHSTEEFRAALLRTRNWDQLEQTEDPAFQWTWASEADRLRYRSLRDDAETMGRRVSLFTATLVANRLLAGLTAALSARSHNRSLDVAVSVRPSPTDQTRPLAHVALRW